MNSFLAVPSRSRKHYTSTIYTYKYINIDLVIITLKLLPWGGFDNAKLTTGIPYLTVFHFCTLQMWHFFTDWKFLARLSQAGLPFLQQHFLSTSLCHILITPGNFKHFHYYYVVDLSTTWFKLHKPTYTQISFTKQYRIINKINVF